MKKGFLWGVSIGVLASMAYEASSKAKKGLQKGKKMVKDKLNDMME